MTTGNYDIEIHEIKLARWSARLTHWNHVYVGFTSRSAQCMTFFKLIWLYNQHIAWYQQHSDIMRWILVTVLMTMMIMIVKCHNFLVSFVFCLNENPGLRRTSHIVIPLCLIHSTKCFFKRYCVNTCAGAEHISLMHNYSTTTCRLHMRFTESFCTMYGLTSRRPRCMSFVANQPQCRTYRQKWMWLKTSHMEVYVRFTQVIKVPPFPLLIWFTKPFNYICMHMISIDSTLVNIYTYIHVYIYILIHIYIHIYTHF